MVDKSENIPHPLGTFQINIGKRIAYYTAISLRETKINHQDRLSRHDGKPLHSTIFGVTNVEIELSVEEQSYRPMQLTRC